jgi:hypothetical protein
MRTASFLIPTILALCVAPLAGADQTIAVVVPALLDANAAISGKVKQECEIDVKLGNQVYQSVSEKYPGAEQIPSSSQIASDRNVVRVTVVGALGAGGGAWSGPKSITIRADLLQGSKVIDTKTLSRQSGGGAFGGFKGTCGIMDRITVALGRDVASWLPRALSMAKPAPSSTGEASAQPPTEEKAPTATTGSSASESKQ